MVYPAGLEVRCRPSKKNGNETFVTNEDLSTDRFIQDLRMKIFIADRRGG
ncbi:unnamed protein product [Hapterophycus canaliculatus]